jgi:hypothetical protein
MPAGFQLDQFNLNTLINNHTISTNPAESNQKSIDSLVQSNSSAAQQPILFNWSVFSSGLSLPNNFNLNSIRILFQDYISLTNELVGSEKTSIDIQSAASALYKAAINYEIYGEITRKQFEYYYGRVYDNKWKQAVKLAKELNQFKATHSGNHHNAKQHGEVNNNINTEFGASIGFAIDLTLLDEEEGEEEEEERLDELFESEEEKETADQLTNQVANDSISYDLPWLVRECESLASYNERGELIGLEPIGNVRTVIDLLDSKASNDDLQSSLLDLLGFEAIDFISALLSNRSKLRQISSQQINFYKKPRIISDVPQPTIPSHMKNLLGVSITSQNQKDTEKRNKKISRKMLRNSERSIQANNHNSNDINEQKLDEQANLLTSMRLSGSAALVSLIKGLPDGTKRLQFPAYEEVLIPPNIPTAIDAQQLTPITVFPDYARVCFGSLSKLNRIQSACYEAAYKTNQNLLIAAPTGAGNIISTCIILSQLFSTSLAHSLCNFFLVFYLLREDIDRPDVHST